MRALQVFGSRLRATVIVAVLALCGPAPAWSDITSPFSNAWSGAFSAADLISEPFLQSVPVELDLRSAAMTLINGEPAQGAWVGPGGQIELVFGVTFDPADGNEFLRKFSGTFMFSGGSSRYENRTDSGGTFESFLFYSAPGTLVQATTISRGTIAFVPDPTVWLMLAAGLALLGFVRIRRAAHSSI